ncbi:hypothetical protein [Gordonia paraffinivorans]|nr:hypothetical protein [Gordonia paraffinivorans]
MRFGCCAHATPAFVNSWSLTEEFGRELLDRIGGRSRLRCVHF